MPEPLQIGQFAIVDHEPVERGPNAGMAQSRGAGDDRAELFLLAEGTTPAGEEFAAHLVSQAERSWKALDMSVTGALGHLFTQTQQSLREWNRKSIAQHHVGAGLICLAVQGSRAVIATRGPCVAFHTSGGATTAHVADEAYAAPLDGDNAPSPQLIPVTLQPGDRVLLASSPLPSEVDDELVGGILALPLDEVLPDLYRRVSHVRNVTVLLVASPIDAEAAPPAPSRTGGAEAEPVIGGGTTPPAVAPAEREEGDAESRRPQTMFQPSLFIDGGPADASDARKQLEAIGARPRLQLAAVATTETEPLRLRRVSGDDWVARLLAEQRAAASRAAADAALSQPPAAPAAVRWRREHPAAEASAPPPPESSSRSPRPQRPGSFTRELTQRRPRPAPEHQAVSDAPLVSELAEGRRAEAARASAATLTETIAGEAQAASQRSRALVRVRGEMGGGRWKGGGTIGTRNHGGGMLPPTWLIVLGGIGMLVLLVGWLTVPGLLESDEGERLAGLLDEAERELATADVQQDLSAKRAALTRAQGILLEASELEDGPALAEPLMSQVAGAIATMDAITPPAEVSVIADLSEFGETPVAAGRLAIGPSTIYLLDSTAGHVLATSTETGETSAVYPPAEATETPLPAAIAYSDMVELGGGALIIAMQDGSIWTYQPGTGAQAVSLAAPEPFAITDIAVFEGNLYVLDAPHAVVYRFAADSGGFPIEPAIVTEAPELADARRLMFDGDLFTADAAGKIHRYSGELSLVLSEAGIDKPLVAAETPRVLGDGGEVAVLDPANDRIVVLGRDGTFLRQYRHDDFLAVTAFAVRDGIGYVFSGQQLRRVDF